MHAAQCNNEMLSGFMFFLAGLPKWPCRFRLFSFCIRQSLHCVILPPQWKSSAILLKSRQRFEIRLGVSSTADAIRSSNSTSNLQRVLSNKGYSNSLSSAPAVVIWNHRVFDLPAVRLLQLQNYGHIQRILTESIHLRTKYVQPSSPFSPGVVCGYDLADIPLGQDYSKSIAVQTSAQKSKIRNRVIYQYVMI